MLVFLVQCNTGVEKGTCGIVIVARVTCTYDVDPYRSSPSTVADGHVSQTVNKNGFGVQVTAMRVAIV